MSGQMGEQLVGTYLKQIRDCTMVSYREMSRGTDHNEVDVVGIDGGDHAYLCEVATHLSGLSYSTKTVRKRFQNQRYSDTRGNIETCSRIWEKFEFAWNEFGRGRLLTLESCELQFWAPVVTGSLEADLNRLAEEFEHEANEGTLSEEVPGVESVEDDLDESLPGAVTNPKCEVTIIVGEEYEERIRALLDRAATEETEYSLPAYRTLQILGHCLDATDITDGSEP